MAASRSSRWPSVITVFLPAFALLSLLSVAWALATPVFASPDENAHATKAIAQVRGELFGHHQPGTRFPVVDLPDDYRYPAAITCFAFHPDSSGSCGVELGGSAGTDWFATWVSSYNPVYYYLVGWPSLLLGGSAGIYAMRLVSALICCALLAAAFWTGMATTRARWMPAGLAFLAAPMVMFLSASISPQGLEVASASLLTVSLLRLVERQREDDPFALSRRQLWVLVTLSAAFLALARATGPLWVVLVVVGVLWFAGWRTSAPLFARRANYIWIGVIAAVGLFSVIWTAFTGTLSGQAEKADAPLAGGTFLQGAWAMLRGTPGYWESAAGVFGWLDTPLPGLVYTLFFGALLVLLVLALFATGRRGWKTVIVAGVIAVLVPVLVQAVSVSRTGIIWQGRYGLFLYLAVILVLAAMLSRSGAGLEALSARISATITALLALYGIAAFVLVLRRYVVGADDPITKMLTSPEWEPPLGWPALVVISVVGSVAFAAWNIRLGITASRRDGVRVESTTHG